MKHITVFQAIDSVEDYTNNLDVRKERISQYIHFYSTIRTYCEKKGMTTFSLDDAQSLCDMMCPDMPKWANCMFRKAAFTIARFCETGSFEWSMVNHSYPHLPDEYTRVMQEFREEMLKTLGDGTVRVGIVIVRQFLCYLEDAGIHSFRELSSKDVIEFVSLESPRHKGSMDKLIRTMRKFVVYLRVHGIRDIDADRFLTKTAKCRRKILPCFTQDEISKIFAQIDRNSVTGKRDYAIFLTALRTGLRASDISTLRLNEIDWNTETLRIVQKKTKAALEVPMPADVGNAISDYILNARTKGTNPYVFQRIKHPTRPEPINPTAFNAYLRKYMEAAGIDRKGWDGKTFHAFRRTAGTGMVSMGVPISTVAQVLGHRNVNSSKSYISMDTTNLEECCMDISGIATRKEGLS